MTSAAEGIGEYNRRHDAYLRLVVKEHPSDHGRIDYSDTFRAFPDVVFTKLLNTQQLIEKSDAVITVNSTVGIEAMLDTANHIIAREGLTVPGSYREAMETLVREKILPASQRENFLRMTSFRNRVVHLYDQIDPVEVYGILEGHLGDFESFLGAISRRYFTSDEREVP